MSLCATSQRRHSWHLINALMQRTRKSVHFGFISSRGDLTLSGVFNGCTTRRMPQLFFQVFLYTRSIAKTGWNKGQAGLPPASLTALVSELISTGRSFLTQSDGQPRGTAGHNAVRRKETWIPKDFAVSFFQKKIITP